MSQHWTYPGARWWKFDFHAHTPASKDTFAWQQAIGTPHELTPEAWLLQYMAAGIDCVAVTDNNSSEWVDKLKSAYARMKHAADSGTPPHGFRELHLFPGVEISVQGGFHLLAIFDLTASSQTISDVLSVVGYGGTRGDSDGVTHEGATKAVEKVLNAGGVAIPAHVDGDKGLLQIEQSTGKCRIDTTTVRQVIQVPGLLALEWCNPDARPPMFLQELKLKFAKVVGSDCHSFRSSAIPGSKYTWIKMATPSLEGLRLALLDGQGVSVRRSDDDDRFAPFETPVHFIESIEISKAQWMGMGNDPARLPLNPYFNALVGGRGTGKSTVVHALRLAFRREKELPSNTEAGQTFTRFNKVAKKRSDEGGLRADTQVLIQIRRDGIVYRLIWRQDGNGHVVEEWDDATQAFRASDSQSITEQRFPVRIFSQGQIAALTGDSQQALLKIIDEAAGTHASHAAFEEAKRNFFSVRAQLRELGGKLQARDALNLSLQDIQRKLTRFEDANHAAVLKHYQRTSRQHREVERQFENARELTGRLKEFVQGLLAEDLPEGLFEANSAGSAHQIVQKLHGAINIFRSEVERNLTQLDDKTNLLKAELEASTWNQSVMSAHSAYERLKSELQAQGVSDPGIYGHLVHEKQRLEAHLKQLDSLQEKYSKLSNQHNAALALLWEARRKISADRQKFIEQSFAENKHIRITLHTYLGKFISLINPEDDDTKTKSAWAKLSMAEREHEIIKIQASTLREMLGDSGYKQFSELNPNIINEPQLPPFNPGISHEFISTTTDSQSYDQWLTWIAEDALGIEYSRKGNGKNWLPIEQASAGQRAAAMLAFLLAHGTEPLVLDQPEDDLDNHLIYDLVVQQIRSNKLRRQLIIVTHNPNIVVNGDAELIHVLDFKHQCYVKQTGSLQDQTMRTEVCQVMEGGKDAFERRYQRLGREV